LMEDGAYLLPSLSVQHGLDRDRHVRSALHTREATRVERVQHVAYRLWRTAQGLRNLCRCVSLCARKQYLAAAHGEGLGTTQPSFERAALVVCDMANREVVS
jgi:hypothetical protein